MLLLVAVDGGVGGVGGGDGGGGCWVVWLWLKVVVVYQCDAVRSHLSEISLNPDCNFEFTPVSSTNCL